MFDYKKIIRSRDLRIKLLGLFNWVPDRWMVRLQYWIHFSGRKLYFNAPERYTEKVQVYKCLYLNPVMGQCVDKYQVRNYIVQIGEVII